MLLSRLTGIQPTGDVMVPLLDKRAVTTATMMSPATAAGRAIVSDDAREARAVVRPRRTIEPSGVPDGGLDSGSTSVMPLAGPANAPASALAASKAVQAASAIRGRLPNIFFTSAERPPHVRFSPFWCTPWAVRGGSEALLASLRAAADSELPPS